jgi:hypothetical protein
MLTEYEFKIWTANLVYHNKRATRYKTTGNIVALNLRQPRGVVLQNSSAVQATICSVTLAIQLYQEC